MLTYAFLLISLTLACSSGGTQTNNPTAKAAESQPTSDTQNQELQNQLAQIASTAKGKVGIAVVLLETGETVSLNTHDHYPMQSVYKLPISMAVMKQVDAGKVTLDQKVPVTKSDFVRRGQNSPIRDKNPNGAEITVTELLRYSISESDGMGLRRLSISATSCSVSMAATTTTRRWAPRSPWRTGRRPVSGRN